MKEHYPLVSIVIPVFNAGQYLEATLQSIVQQTYPHWEIIVVNDGSTDHSEKVIGRFPVQQYLYQANQGPARARNQGLACARGEFIAFLDADDRWPPHKLETQLRCFANEPALQIVTGLVEFLFSPGDPKADQYHFQYDHNRAIHAHLGAGLFRRDVFGLIGTFNEAMRFSEDIDWYNRAKENDLRIKVLEDIALYLTIHPDSLTYGASVGNNGTFMALKLALDRRRQQGIGQVRQLSEYRPSDEPAPQTEHTQYPL